MTPAQARVDDRSIAERPAFAERFRFIKPTLPAFQEVVDLYRQSYSGGVITNANLVTRFENAVCERLNVPHCVAVSSCTSGLMLAMRAMELQGEVILPSFTFFATGHAVTWNGLTPVFADCDPHTWTVDPADVERKITAKTSAILAVHMYGNPCDIEGLSRIARKHGLKLIFDSAHAFGSRFQGRPVGQFGDVEVFSLSPTKLLVAGEGGLVTTHDAELAHLLRAGRNYGDLGTYDPMMRGVNARMPEFNAALGLSGLSLMDDKLKRHNEIARSYTEMLSNVPGLTFQHVRPGDTCTFKDYSVHVNPAIFGCTRDELAAMLLAHNVETKKYFYPPMHEQKLYRQYASDPERTLPNTISIAGGVLSLPIYESLPNETVRTVAALIQDIATQ